MINLLLVADNSNIIMEIIPGNESATRQYNMISGLPILHGGGMASVCGEVTFLDGQRENALFMPSVEEVIFIASVCISVCLFVSAI